MKRTDWIDFDPNDIPEFRRKAGQAIDEVFKLADYEEMLLDIALDAPAMDCAVALERAQKAFLHIGQAALLDKAEAIQVRLRAAQGVAQIDDLNRLHDEIAMFIRQGRAAIA